MGIFQKVPKKYLVGNDWANGFKTHNELTMYPLGKYPLAPSDTEPGVILVGRVLMPFEPTEVLTPPRTLIAWK
jgi:hypothetical protein